MRMVFRPRDQVVGGRGPIIGARRRFGNRSCRQRSPRDIARGHADIIGGCALDGDRGIGELRAVFRRVILTSANLVIDGELKLSCATPLAPLLPSTTILYSVPAVTVAFTWLVRMPRPESWSSLAATCG